MSTSPPANVPVALRTARRQFDRWRSRHRPHTRLPEELWRKAATLARKHGLNKTAGALGLKYYSLKKRMEAKAPGVSKAEKIPCEFVELLPSPMTTASFDCTIEVQDGSGTTVRIRVKGVRMAELASSEMIEVYACPCPIMSFVASYGGSDIVWGRRWATFGRSRKHAEADIRCRACPRPLARPHRSRWTRGSWRRSWSGPRRRR